MATLNSNRTQLVCAATAMCNALIAVSAQAQDVSFEAARNFPTGVNPFSVAVGDFNGDGIKDLAVANTSSDNVSVLLGNGDGTFQLARNFAVGSHPSSVPVGDFNGDGRPGLDVRRVGKECRSRWLPY